VVGVEPEPTVEPVPGVVAGTLDATTGASPVIVKVIEPVPFELLSVALTIQAAVQVPAGKALGTPTVRLTPSGLTTAWPTGTVAPLQVTAIWLVGPRASEKVNSIDVGDDGSAAFAAGFELTRVFNA
jgi:hypothetical protein